MRRRSVIATYRLQLHAGFGFDDAADLAPYLVALGVSHVYCSPYLQAAPGSTHGYDVADHSRVNAELGGEAAHRRFLDALRRYGLGQVVDVVPNHMAVGTPLNVWWWDVLENGPASRFASYFDVDWDPPESKLRNQVLVPILGDHYGRELEAGSIAVIRAGDRFEVAYYDHRLPVAPRSLDAVLTPVARRLGDERLAFLADDFADLPPATTTSRIAADRRARDKAVLAELLGQHLADHPEVAAAIDGELAALSADHEALHQLLERQNYRLAFWRTGTRELDYRRFFDVTTLAGIRVEDPEVFDASHRLILEWYRNGDVDGLRIDHPDGLADPAGYLERLRAAAPDAWLLVEKILEPGEELPDDWPVDGTTGYDFVRDLSNLFVDTSGLPALDHAYRTFTGANATFDEEATRAKREVIRQVLSADVDRLTEQFRRLCERQLRYRDFTRAELRRGLEVLLVAFEVYRTYARTVDGRPVVSGIDRERIDAAVGRAVTLDPATDPELFEFLGRALTLDIEDAEATELALRFQQLTGPVMAKGVEDTAFYRYGRLVSLNEVGGDPGGVGSTVEAFHAASATAARRWPDRMAASSTHDTKRSEDVRARISMLAERPAQWSTAVERWAARHEEMFGPLDRPTLYLLYQTLVGVHPISPERLLAYLEKAVREAKVSTSWLEPDENYEQDVRRFAEGALGDATFVEELDRFVQDLLPSARVTSLAQLVVKLTAPGRPDLYQGSELWTDSLVDPDNRRPVDYELRRRLLGALSDPVPEVDETGRAKLFVVRSLLGLRRRCSASFDGGHAPIEVTGAASDHAIAYRRGDGVSIVVPRFPLRLADDGGWRDTTVTLPDGRWTDVFTGAPRTGKPPAEELLAAFPVAVLERTDR